MCARVQPISGEERRTREYLGFWVSPVAFCVTQVPRLELYYAPSSYWQGRPSDTNPGPLAHRVHPKALASTGFCSAQTPLVNRLRLRWVLSWARANRAHPLQLVRSHLLTAAFTARETTDVDREIFLHDLYLSAPNRTVCLRFLWREQVALPRSYWPVPLRLHTQLHTTCAP